jgi:UDP:flavonoid glycosyltransferase YjiC (YdhE family)
MPVDGAGGEKQIDGDAFGAAVRRVLNEPGYRQSARRVAASMSHFGGAQEAARRIENLAAGQIA